MSSGGVQGEIPIHPEVVPLVPNDRCLTEYEEFYPYLWAELPGVNKPLLFQTVQNVAREFCEKTHAWRWETEEIDLIAGETLYEFEGEYPHCYSDVHRVVQVRIDCSLQKPFRDYYVTHDEKAIRLTREPNEQDPGKLVITLVLKPKRRGDRMGKRVFEDHYEAVVAGTLYKMFRIPDKTWTNFALSDHHRQRYYALRTEAKTETYKKNTVGDLSVRARGMAGFFERGRTAKRQAAN